MSRSTRRRAPIFTPYGDPEPGELYLQPTPFMDFDEPAVRRFAEEAGAGASSPREKAVRAFYAVRDGIRYDPYTVKLTPRAFAASSLLAAGRGYCVPKAVLLAAVCRCLGIPTAIGLSDVVNHLSSPKLQETLGYREVFINHAYAVMYLEGKWVKAVPAFNKELCEFMGVAPTEFDGLGDAILQEYDRKGGLATRYLKHHGCWSDLPYNRVRDDFLGYYPRSLTHMKLPKDLVFGRE